MQSQNYKSKAGFVLIILFFIFLPQIVFALEYKTIRKNMKNMTSLEWDRYTKSLEGRQINKWVGWISDVEKQWFGGYKILIDMDPPGSLSVQDIYIEDQPLSVAEKFRKNQKVIFSGKIKRVMSIMGTCAVTLEKVTFK